MLIDVVFFGAHTVSWCNIAHVISPYTWCYVICDWEHFIFMLSGSQNFIGSHAIILPVCLFPVQFSTIVLQFETCLIECLLKQYLFLEMHQRDAFEFQLENCVLGKHEYKMKMRSINVSKTASENVLEGIFSMATFLNPFLRWSFFFFFGISNVLSNKTTNKNKDIHEKTRNMNLWQAIMWLQDVGSLWYFFT